MEQKKLLNETSRERIEQAGMKEFLQKGYQEASLRTIAKEAGVTTGSFYWHFKNKEELFDALVAVHYEHIMNLYQEAFDRFFAFPLEKQKEQMGQIGRNCMLEMLDYIYQHKEVFQLLINKAAGTKYENMMHELTEAEIESTRRFARHMENLGIQSRTIMPELEHIIVSGMFSAFFELITHNIDEKTARNLACGLYDFHTAGWRYLLNVPDQTI